MHVDVSWRELGGGAKNSFGVVLKPDHERLLVRMMRISDRDHRFARAAVLAGKR